jgi:hypothetical protein
MRKIKELFEFELNPRPGVIVAESVQSLLIQRDTLKLRMEVIADLLEQCRTALNKVAEDNKRISRALDLREHKL